MVHNVVRSEYLKNKRGAVVVQIQGSVGGATPDIDGAGVASTLGRALGRNIHTFSAPMVVADARNGAGLLRDQHIRKTLEMARALGSSLSGIGAVRPRSRASFAPAISTTRISNTSADRVRSVISVGTISAQDGSLCPLELKERMIALDADAIRRTAFAGRRNVRPREDVAEHWRRPIRPGERAHYRRSCGRRNARGYPGQGRERCWPMSAE